MIGHSLSNSSHLDTGHLLPTDLDVSDAKRRLYEVALALFGDLGYHAVSLRDIADTLGQKPNAMYAHVDSKLELLFDLANIGQRLHYESIRDAWLDAGSDPAQQLRAIVGAHLDHHLDYPALSRLVHREMRTLDPGQLEAVLVIRRQAEQLIIDVIDRGVRRGDFRVGDTFLAGRAIGSMAVRIPEWWHLEPSNRTREEIRASYVDFALRVVGAR